MASADTIQPQATEPPTAVVWISGRHAVVAIGDIAAGRIESWTTERMVESEAEFLARIVRAVGDSGRVMVLGGAGPRLAVQRAYVAISHHPDRLVGASRHGRIDPDALAERVRALGV